MKAFAGSLGWLFSLLIFNISVFGQKPSESNITTIGRFAISVCNCTGPSIGVRMGEEPAGLDEYFAFTIYPGPFASADPNFTIEKPTPGEVLTLEFLPESDETLVELELQLPKQLTREDGSEVECSFPSNGLYWVENNRYMDPGSPLWLELGATQKVTMKLRMNISSNRRGGENDLEGIINPVLNITGL